MSTTTQQFRIALATLSARVFTDRFSKDELIDEARNEEEHAAMVEQRDPNFSHLEGATKPQIRQILIDRGWALDPSDVEDEGPEDPNPSPDIESFKANGLIVELYEDREDGGFRYRLLTSKGGLVTEARKPHDDLNHARRRATKKARKYGGAQNAA